jgi:hypothetical protein
MIGKKLQPILNEIEETILESNGVKPHYPEESMRSSTQIFMSVLMDKMHDKQIKDGLSLEHSCEMANNCGDDLRQLINTYTGLDSFEFYK